MPINFKEIPGNYPPEIVVKPPVSLDEFLRAVSQHPDEYYLLLRTYRQAVGGPECEKNIAAVPRPLRFNLHTGDFD
jgi:hypothetical protein